MLEVKELTKSFCIKGRNVSALSGINVSFPDTGLVCVCGRSGSGKTTLLNLLGLQDSAGSGKILYNGKNIFDFSEKEKNGYRRCVAGRVSQDFDLINNMTAYENCELAAGLRLPYSDVREAVSRALDRVGLSGYEVRKVNELSGGEKQRVAIARALAGAVPILLCDEPTGNLDPETSSEIMGLLRDLSADICVIVVTHNRGLAEKYADRIIDLSGGHITSDRTVSGSVPPVRAVDCAEDEASTPSGRRGSVRRRLPLKYVLKFAWLSALSQKRISAAVAVLLAFVTSLLLTASYMSSYSRAKSIAANMKNQRLYSVDISDYTQKLYSDGPGFESPSGLPITPSMTDELKSEYPLLHFGSCYSFGRTFYDFSDAENLENGFFNTISFGNYIVVDNFDDFSYDLEFGTFPSKEDEVLIFDYMADNIIRCKLFEEVKERSDLIGYTMTDGAVNVSMTVSGILKSNYADFSTVGDEFDFFLRDNDYYVANYCLTKYRSVFGTPALAEKIILSTDKVSFERMDFSVKYFNDYERERETAVLNGKYKLNCRPGELPEGLTILYGDSNQLFYVRDTVVANLLGVPVEQVTPGFLESFFGDEDSVEMEFELTYSCSDHNGGYTYNFDYSATSTTVFHWDGDEDLLIIEMEDNGYAFSRTGGYCGPVLLLGRGVDENARQIAQLIPVLHDSSWWNDDPEKVETGYTIHSHFDDVLQRLDEYLKVNNSLFGRYAWLVAVFLAAAVFFYTTSSVKKNERSIGILRSVGVSRGGVMAVFASSSIGIMIASVPVAIVASLIILHKANSILSEGFGVELSVYFFDASAVGRSLLIIACSTVAAMLLTWLWLVIRKPVNMIYERRG